jgi:hypothetical protein
VDLTLEGDEDSLREQRAEEVESRGVESVEGQSKI